jgi:hypothetical protein
LNNYGSGVKSESKTSPRDSSKVDIGTLRETFAIVSLAESHTVEYGKAQGDFKVDGKYTFEIGGRSKDFS